MVRKKLVDGRQGEGGDISYRILGLLEELRNLTQNGSMLAEFESIQSRSTGEPKSNRIRELEEDIDPLLRLKQVLEIIPVGKSTWWAGVKTGRYPAPVHHLGPRVTAWRLSSILRLAKGK